MSLKSQVTSPKLFEIMPLSEEQLPALNLEKGNLLVSAGAGSGKTRVLISRFAHTVMTGAAKINEILAITFTEKAASEMKKRLVELFEKLGRDDLRREVEEAYVSTLHSFASRILREYALEIGVDPEFQVITEDEKAALEAEVWEALLDEEALKDDVYSLLRAVSSKENLKDEVLNLRSRFMGAGLLKPWEMTDPPLSGDVIVDSMRTTIHTMEKEVTLTPGEKNCLDSFRIALNEFQSALAGKPFELQLIRDATSFRLNGKRDEEWKSKLSEAREELKGGILLLQDDKTADLRRKMMMLLQVFEDRLERKKIELSFLDFDDLLRKLLEFLRRDDELSVQVRRLLQEKFKFILMDELQDSTRVEIEILEKLSTGNNLFRVGDAKQSIYAFREADVDIFLNLKEQAEKARGFLKLQENYRSRPAILEFINGFFESQIFKDSKISYESMPPTRKEAGDLPCVECLVACDMSEEEPIRKDQRQLWEAEGVAEKIAELYTSNRLPNLSYSEICILLKNFTDVNVYERALRAKGIPYTVIAGRGFYQKREIMDCVSLLKLVENPLDDIALAAVLRSPLVNLSDDGLMELAEERKTLVHGNDDKYFLWHCIGRESFQDRLSIRDKKLLLKFLNLQRYLEKRKSQLTISGVLREIIRATQYDANILLEPDGKRKFVNLEKLLEVAKPFDKRNLSLVSFLGHLEKMTLKEVRESEAQIENENEDTVKILTVHKAKGLEFRVVAFANFDTGSRIGSMTFNFSEEWGLGSALLEVGDEKSDDYRYEKNASLIKKSRSEEAKRIFYVACTRARDYLILSTAPDNRATPTSFLAQLLEYLGCQRGENGLFNGVKVSSLHKGIAKKPPSHSFLEEPEFRKAFSSLKKIKTSDESKKLLNEWSLLYKKVQDWNFPSYRGLNASITSLLEYQECPKKYYFRKVLNHPVIFQEDAGKNSEEEVVEDVLKATDFGTYFHSILEKWDIAAKPLETYDEEKNKISAAIPEISRKRLEKELYLFALSPLLEELREAQKVERELSFEWLPSELLRIRGQLDLLYLSRKGEWNLVDYKTNRIEGEVEAEEKGEAYRFQLSAYGAILMKSLNLKRLKCSLYFSGLGKCISWELTDKEVQKFETLLTKTLQNITSEKFPLKRGEVCETCAFQKPCLENFMVKSSHETAASV